jgi:hypothetical protein
MTLASPLTDQLQGWGTATAALAALAAFVAGIAAYRAQAAQLRLQQQQNKDQAELLALQAEELRASSEARQEEAAESRRAQAVQVYIVETVRRSVGARGRPEARFVATFKNASPLPIHDLIITWHDGASETSGLLQKYLAPGDSESLGYIGTDDDTPELPFGAYATARFRDAAGNVWEIAVHGEPRLLHGQFPLPDE